MKYRFMPVGSLQKMCKVCGLKIRRFGFKTDSFLINTNNKVWFNLNCNDFVETSIVELTHYCPAMPFGDRKK